MKFLLRFLKPTLTNAVIELFKPIEREAERTVNQFDDKTVAWVKKAVLDYIQKL